MIKLLIADDEPLLREGMSTLLALDSEFEIVARAANGAQAVEMTCRLSPDVVIMDLQMPVMDGVAATRAIKEKCAAVKILVLTTYDDDQLVVEAMAAGASGYLLKDCGSEQVGQAIRAVFRGYTALAAGVSDKLMTNIAGASKARAARERFTPREFAVLELIGQGKSNQEIAYQLSIAERTVRNHVTAILGELNVRDRTQAALWARKNLD